MISLNLPALHPGQQQVVQEAKRHNVVIAGRRFGKSVLLRDRLIHEAAAGRPTAWVSPTYKMVSESWRSILQYLQPMVIESNVTERRILLSTGGSIEFWSLDAIETTRGRAYSVIAVDEAAMAANLEAVWKEVLRPTLTDYVGKSWWGSTPRGFGFLKNLYDRGQDPSSAEWKSWQFETSTNPYIAGSEVDTAREDLGERSFDQEFRGQFIDLQNSVFRNIYECATAERLDGPQAGGGPYVFGIDWAGTGRGDYTVVSILDAGARAFVALDRWRSAEYGLQLARVRGMYEHWKPAAIIAEANSMGAPLIAQLRGDGIPILEFVTTNPSKAFAIEQLSLAFERRTIQIIPDATLIAELQAFSASRLPSGMVRYAAAGGTHDDCVIGLMLAWAAIEGPEAVESRLIMSDDPASEEFGLYVPRVEISDY
ncbi:MAG TPA: hypothetical protein VM120_23940 [Bryobacteraceae bacterium]|nr:hypothetical protein [Bryobacteraceae bacterium]